MSTDYTHLDKLSFDQLFARKGPGVEVQVMDSDGNISGIGNITTTGTLSVQSLTATAGITSGSAVTAVSVNASGAIHGATLSSTQGVYSGSSVLAAAGISGLTISATTGIYSGSSITAVGSITGSNLTGTNSGDVTIGTANGLSLSSQVISLATSSSSTIGALSAADWTTFNAKQPAGNYLVTITGEATTTYTSAGSATIALVNSSVIGKVLTGYTSGSGTISTADTILSAIQKLNGNDGTKLSLTGGSLTGALNASAVTMTGALSGSAATFTGAISASNLTGTNSGDVTIGTANGLSLSSQAISMAAASSSVAGVISTSAQSVAGIKTFANGIQLPTSGGTAATFSYYEEYSGSLTFTGSGVTTSGTIKITQIGKLVTIEVFQISGTGNNTAATIAAGAIPTRFFPAQTEYQAAFVRNNGTNALGFLSLDSTGILTFNNLPAANFNGSVILFQTNFQYSL